MMKLRKKEQHGFLSGFFKAREYLFLSPDTQSLIVQAETLDQWSGYIANGRYAKTIAKLNDPKAFESALWETYFNELKQARNQIDEPYLTKYLTYFHSIIFSQKEIAFDLRAEKIFEERLAQWVDLSLHGTNFTKKLSSYAVDHFNLAEFIRSQFHQDTMPPYYAHGNLPKSSLKVLFDSQFQHIPKDIIFSLWHPFVEKEKPAKKINFDLILRLEYFWLDVMWNIFEEPLKEPYGIDYLLAYFLRFMLEIENVKRHYFRLKYGLPVYWMKERH